MTDIDWSSSCRADDFISYNFSTGTVQCYPAEKIPPVKRQKVDDNVAVPVMVPAIDMSCCSGVTSDSISEIECDYRGYQGTIDDAAYQPTDALADVVDDPDDVFVQKVLRE